MTGLRVTLILQRLGNWIVNMLKTKQSFHKNEHADLSDTLFCILSAVTKDLNRRQKSSSECTFFNKFM